LAIAAPHQYPPVIRRAPWVLSLPGVSPVAPGPHQILDVLFGRVRLGNTAYLQYAAGIAVPLERPLGDPKERTAREILGVARG